jgi:HD-GYP domain-containing protein (c-di-GMP phosphodiesterase class II)
MDASLLNRLLSALDMVVIEQSGDGSFKILGSPPDWFKHLFHQVKLGGKRFTIEDELSFLGSFVTDAAEFWRLQQAGQILWSGPWEETLESGEDATFEAGAICLEGRNILIVRLLSHIGMADRQVLQKAKEHLLSFENLLRTEKDIEKYSGYLEQEVLKRTSQVRKTLTGVIQAIATITEMRDPYTAGHQQRVTQLAVAIAAEMGLPTEQIDCIRVTGNLHDAGKICIPAEILSKPGKLTEMELDMFKLHSQAGYDILQTVEFPCPVAQIVLQHHERMNGSGYPKGLRGEDILLESRILAVADVVEAMSSHRPYRPALGEGVALEHIAESSGILYDPKVVDACFKLFYEKGFKFQQV